MRRMPDASCYGTPMENHIGNLAGQRITLGGEILLGLRDFRGQFGFGIADGGVSLLAGRLYLGGLLSLHAAMQLLLSLVYFGARGADGRLIFPGLGSRLFEALGGTQAGAF